MPARKSIGELIAEVPTLVTNLLRAEIDQLKTEMTDKGKALGIGAGLLGGAAFLAIFVFGYLLLAGFEGLKLVVPAWGSALIVAGVLLLIVGILAAIGIAKLRAMKSLTPDETIQSVKRDVKVIQGLGSEARGDAPAAFDGGER